MLFYFKFKGIKELDFIVSLITPKMNKEYVNI